MDRPDYETAKKTLILDPSAQSADSQGTVDTKAPPEGPPQPLVRRYPARLAPIVAWIEEIVANEGLVLDLCMDKAMQIIDFHYKRGLVGIDYFPEHQNGQAPTRFKFVAIATPLAVRLFEEVEKAIESRKDELAALVVKMQGSDAPPPPG